MPSLKLSARLGVVVAVALAASAAVGAAPSGPTVISAIDLAGPFAARSAWRFTASQGPSVADPDGSAGDEVPGDVRLCLRKAASGACDPQLLGTLSAASTDDSFSQPHYLNDAKIVEGAPGHPLLLVQTASLHSGDGDQLVFTQALAYRRETDEFVRVYDHQTGRNNNQEVRYVEKGPLKGDIISAEPTENAPFGFWVVVNTLTPGRAYKEVLRYRSATRYGDGNPLSVIDSEMANIEQRLGLWRPGAPLPLPTRTPCLAPHLIHMELWCAGG